jgi:hypothetical protein
MSVIKFHDQKFIAVALAGFAVSCTANSATAIAKATTREAPCYHITKSNIHSSNDDK